MDAVFRALASAQRRQILDVVKSRPGLCVQELAEDFDISRVGVLKHLAVLEEAGLIASERDGRMRRLWLNPTPIQIIHERWTTEYGAFWAARLTELKRRVETSESER